MSRHRKMSAKWMQSFHRHLHKLFAFCLNRILLMFCLFDDGCFQMFAIATFGCAVIFFLSKSALLCRCLSFENVEQVVNATATNSCSFLDFAQRWHFSCPVQCFRYFKSVVYSVEISWKVKQATEWVATTMVTSHIASDAVHFNYDGHHIHTCEMHHFISSDLQFSSIFNVFLITQICC